MLPDGCKLSDTGIRRSSCDYVNAFDRGRGVIPCAEMRAFIRPLFHQLEPCVKAHVMVAFPGYALWVTLKHLLKRRPAVTPPRSVSGVTDVLPLSAMKALALLSTWQSADIVLPTTGWPRDPLASYCRTHGRAEALLQQLGLVLPERFELNCKCSVDSAKA